MPKNMAKQVMRLHALCAATLLFAFLICVHDMTHVGTKSQRFALRDMARFPARFRKQAKEVVILVMSKRDNFEARQAIRETWGRKRQVLFVVGNHDCPIHPKFRDVGLPCSSTQQLEGEDTGVISKNDVEAMNIAYVMQSKKVATRLVEEKHRHNDLLELDLMDSYGNLAEKTKQSIVWASKHRPGAWVFKVDDDTLVDVDLLQSYLSEKDPSQLCLVGALEYHNQVLREGKWAERTFNETTYPVYPQGSAGYALSGSLVRALAEKSDSLPLYHNEDATVGIWLRQLNLKGLVLENVAKSDLHDYKGCLVDYMVEKRVTYAHRLSPVEIRQCYRYVTEGAFDQDFYKLRAQEVKAKFERIKANDQALF